MTDRQPFVRPSLTRTLFRHATHLAFITAFLLRLALAFSRDPLAAYTMGGGGDEAWYLANGYGLVSGESYGLARGISFEVKTQPGAVAYLIMVGLPQRLFDDATAVRVIWLIQALMSAGLCVFAFGITRHLTQSDKAGMIAAWVMALHPSLILASSYILTETLFLFLAGGAAWLYIDRISVRGLDERPLRPLLADAMLVGLICGAAVLTRAVFILFPLWLVAHVLWQGRRPRRRTLPVAGVLLISYAAMTLTWTAFLALNYGRFVIASTQFMPTVWRGVVTDEAATPQEMDAALQADCQNNCTQGAGTQVYTGQLTAAVQADLTGVIARRGQEWLAAVLTPYPAAEIGGESLRALVLDWVQRDRSWAGLGRLIQGDYFVLKLALYVFHYGGLVLGIVGLWRFRRQGAVTPILFGFLLYTYAIHTVLLAIPRYIFPSQLYWWCAGAASLWELTDRQRLSRGDEHDNGH